MVLGNGILWVQHSQIFLPFYKFLTNFYASIHTNAMFLQWTDSWQRKHVMTLYIQFQCFPFPCSLHVQPARNAQVFLSTNYFKHNSNYHLYITCLCNAIGSSFCDDTLGLPAEALRQSIVYLRMTLECIYSTGAIITFTEDRSAWKEVCRSSTLSTINLTWTPCE